MNPDHQVAALLIAAALISTGAVIIAVTRSAAAERRANPAPRVITLTTEGQAQWEAHVADALAYTERASVIPLPGRRLAVVPEQRQAGEQS